MCKWIWAVSFFYLVPQMSFVVYLNSVLSPCQVVCSCCLQPSPTQCRGFICSQSHKGSWVQPIWRHWLPSASLVGGSAGFGVGDKIQGCLTSQHTQRHPPRKPKPSVAEVIPSSLACNPVSFGLNEPGRKVELAKITPGGSTKKKGRQRWQHLSFWSQKKKKKKSTSSLQNKWLLTFLPELKVSQQQPRGWGRISVSHSHDQSQWIHCPPSSLPLMLLCMYIPPSHPPHCAQGHVSSTSPEGCAEPLHDELIHHPSPKEAFCSSAPQRCLWWCQGPFSNDLRFFGCLTPSALPTVCWAPKSRQGKEGAGLWVIPSSTPAQFSPAVTPGCCLADPHVPAALGPFLLAFPFMFLCGSE